MPIEIEAPEGIGYENIACNLSESSYADQRLSDLGINIGDLLLYYGDHKGKRELRELLSAEIGLPADNVLITSGAATGLFIIATSLLDKGHHVVVAKPNYATNLETPRALGAAVSYLRLTFENKFDLDLQELERLITPATKFVSLTYPHNPTGVTIDESKLRAVIALVEEKGTYLILDETYREMSFGPKLPIAATLSDRVISITSMSKSYGLPGIRIGWISCQNEQLMETFLAAKEQICITNSVVDEEIAFQYLLQKEKLFGTNLTNIKENFARVTQFMNSQSVLEWVKPQGGCVCFPRIRADIKVDIGRFHDILLNKYSTYVGKGHWFEEDARFIRIGYSWDKRENLDLGLKNILKAIDDARIS